TSSRLTLRRVPCPSVLPHGYLVARAQQTAGAVGALTLEKPTCPRRLLERLVRRARCSALANAHGPRVPVTRVTPVAAPRFRGRAPHPCPSGTRCPIKSRRHFDGFRRGGFFSPSDLMMRLPFPSGGNGTLA